MSFSFITYMYNQIHYGDKVKGKIFHITTNPEHYKDCLKNPANVSVMLHAKYQVNLPQVLTGGVAAPRAVP